MSKRPRRNRSPPFKAQMVSAAVKGGAAQGSDDAQHRWKGRGEGKTLAELARQYDVHPNLIDQWRSRLLEGAADVFGAEPAAAEPAVMRPNQVWASEITYVPIARGLVYFVAIVDWFSRRMPAWQVSTLLDAGFCIEALEEALARYGKPAIFNSDQEAQFTSTAFTAVLHREQIAISMDGKGRCRDNVFVERLWRSVKYEEPYLNAYAPVAEARAGIRRCLRFYNAVRPHSALGGHTPDRIYFAKPLLAAA